MGNGPKDLGTHGVIEAFLRRARQRHLLQLGMDAGTYAATAAFFGAILLLLAGTQILNWWWPGALFLAAFCVAGWRLRGKVAPLYLVAQRVDRRLELHDAVSS